MILIRSLHLLKFELLFFWLLLSKCTVSFEHPVYNAIQLPNKFLVHVRGPDMCSILLYAIRSEVCSLLFMHWQSLLDVGTHMLYLNFKCMEYNHNKEKIIIAKMSTIMWYICALKCFMTEFLAHVVKTRLALEIHLTCQLYR